MTNTTINATSFGRYADQVQEFGGEYTLPVGEDYDIHPGHNGGWCVVAVKTGGVLCSFANLDDAVKYAESR